MDKYDLRSIILKLEQRLSNDDRKRLHFFLGDDVPRRIRDDPSLSGTLNLMESLIDQDKINENDLTFLIKAFKEIQCMDAVKLLKKHMRRMPTSIRHKSVQSLTSIMPPTGLQLYLETVEFDKPNTEESVTIELTEESQVNNRFIDTNNSNEYSASSRLSCEKLRRQLLKMKKSILITLVLLSIIGIGIGILILLVFRRNHQLTKTLEIKESIIRKQKEEVYQAAEQLTLCRSTNNQTSSNQDKVNDLWTLARKQNETIQSLNTLRNQLCRNLIKFDKKVTSCYIKSNTRWKQMGVTVAGGNGPGNGSNQFHRPQSLFIDDDKQCIYIADKWNHRIIEWKYNHTTGKVVAGGNGKGNQISQLDEPTSVIVDKNSDALIICDKNNKRIVQWSRQNGTQGQILILNISCRGLAIDNDQYLYVSDCDKDEVRKWKLGEYSNGLLVAGGRGKGKRSHQFDHPMYFFIDRKQAIYVSDVKNNRVMKWKKNATHGIFVAGGDNRLKSPNGVLVDDFGNVYVADNGNNRIMLWSKDTKESRVVVDGNGNKESPNELNRPSDISFDREGNLYVVDYSNDRIRKFEIDWI